MCVNYTTVYLMYVAFVNSVTFFMHIKFLCSWHLYLLISGDLLYGESHGL